MIPVTPTGGGAELAGQVGRLPGAQGGPKIWGTVQAVDAHRAGSQLTGGSSPGATTIDVESTYDFDEAGGQLEIKGSGANEIADYDSVDDAAKTVHLTAGLALGWGAGTRVNLWPHTQDRLAHVLLFDDPNEAVLATVPHQLFHAVAAGLRAPKSGDPADLQQETVYLEHDGDLYNITDVISKDLVAGQTRYLTWASTDAPGAMTGTVWRFPKDALVLAWQIYIEDEDAPGDIELQLLQDADSFATLTIPSGKRVSDVQPIHKNNSFGRHQMLRVEIVDDAGIVGRVKACVTAEF